MDDKVGMYKDPRYNSGTTLVRTAKEEHIDYLEKMIGEMSDTLFIALKKLNQNNLQELHRVIADRIAETSTPIEDKGD